MTDSQIPRMNFDEAESWSGSARLAFEGREELPWGGDYEALMAEEWPWYDGPGWNRWRLAAYVAWACAPIKGRWPATTEEFAQLVGWSSARPLRNYRAKYHQIDQMVREAALEPLFEARDAVLRTLAEQAMEPDYKTFKDRELFLKLTNVYKPTQDVTVRQETISADEMQAAEERAEAEPDPVAERFGDDDE